MEDGEAYTHSQMLKYGCLLFDLDDTLYPYSSGIAEACTKNIREYMAQRLGIQENKIDELGNLLYKNYGTTMAGLRAIGYDFDYDDYHSFVHSRLPYEVLKPDLVLRNLLHSLPLRKFIFTNADREHARRVLNGLGLEGCFDGIICFESLNPTRKGTVSADEDDEEFLRLRSENHLHDIIARLSQPQTTSSLPKTPIICKPSEIAIQRALQIADIKNSHRALFFDDSVRNVQAGKRIGLDTVLVGKSVRVKGADYALECIHNLREALPELWLPEIKSNVRYAETVGVQTSVTA